MQAAIERELAIIGGQRACVVLRVDGDVLEKLVSINSDQLFPAASLAKVPILVEVARQIELKRFGWETRYAVPEEARLFSSGVLGDLASDLRLSVHDLAFLMITISDNTASNILLDLVGLEAVNNTMRDLGLASTRLERRFLDFEARQAGRDNWTTATDMALLFSLLSSEMLPGREVMRAILLRQNDYTLLPGYWGEDLPFAHKTGGLPGILHDVGILYPPESPRHPLIIAAMTAEQTDEPLARLALARVGRLIYS